MTTQDVLKALRCCTAKPYSDCDDECPYYWCDCDKEELMKMAADQIESLSAELEQVKQERDTWELRAEAAEYDMRKAIMGTGSSCKSCKYPIQDDAPCRVCNCVSHWQWRGPCAENGGANDQI